MPALPKPTEERRVRPSVAIDPNDINAQLALEVLSLYIHIFVIILFISE
jgi:hypothetical protein